MTRCLLIALTVLALFSGSCGKKEWPSPRLDEDTFVFENATGRVDKGCLAARAVISGPPDMLGAVEVRIESLDTPCSGCPFVPTQVAVLPRGDSRVRVENSILSVSYCGLNPSLGHRFKLVGRNALPSLPVAITPVLP